MASLNKIFLMGNLTRDPELRRVGDNNAVCNLGLAVNRRFTSGGEEREETCFVDIETWSRLAETCERYLRKGSLVLVEGRLRQDRWEDRETGAARSKLVVRAESVQFLDGAAGRGSKREGEREGFAGNGDNRVPAPEAGVNEADRKDSFGGRRAEPAAQDDDVYVDKAQEEDDIPF